MLKYLKFIVVLIAIMASVPVFAQQEKYADMEAEVFEYVNDHRAKVGLKPLVRNDTVCEAAMEHCQYMGNKSVSINHDNFEERMHALMKTVKPCYGAAENVARGQKDAREVVDMWLSSPGHKDNIEGDYNMSGVSIYKGGDGRLYFTQIFLKRKYPAQKVAKAQPEG